MQEFYNSYHIIHKLIVLFLVPLLYSEVSNSFTVKNHSDMGIESNDLITVSRKKYFVPIVIESRKFENFTETAGAHSVYSNNSGCL